MISDKAHQSTKPSSRPLDPSTPRPLDPLTSPLTTPYQRPGYAPTPQRFSAGSLLKSYPIPRPLSSLAGKIQFDENGQNPLDLVVLQFQGNASKSSEPTTDIVYPTASATNSIDFPIPDWPIRHCWATCADGYHCDETGACNHKTEPW